MNIWVESIYRLYFPKINVRPFNPRELGGNHANALSYPTIKDTRYFYREGETMPNSYKDIEKTPIVLDLEKKGILNKDWFDADGIDNHRSDYFNYYFVEQMINALIKEQWTEKERYRLIEQEKGNYQHTVHFFRPNLPPQKTVISGIVKNFYVPEISFNGFEEASIVRDFAKNTTIKLDSIGEFNFELNLDKPVFLKLFHDFNHIRIYIEPGDSLFINIDANAIFRKTSFSGSNAISNETLLELYHEIRGDTFWRASDHIVLKKTQLQYLKELQSKKQKELSFLADRKKRLSPQFYQFLDRHIHFQYAGSLLTRMVSFYNYRDAYIDPEYLKACQEVRSLFFRLPEFKTYSWVLYDYLKLGYTMLQGRYTGKGSLANKLAFYSFSKLVYTEPENHFRIGELILYKNNSSYKENNYKRLVKTLIDGCNIISKKKILDDYSKEIPRDSQKDFFRHFPMNTMAPKWQYTLDSTEKFSFIDYLGDYLLLHIGLVKNLDAAKSDIQEIKHSNKKSASFKRERK